MRFEKRGFYQTYNKIKKYEEKIKKMEKFSRYDGVIPKDEREKMNDEILSFLKEERMCLIEKLVELYSGKMVYEEKERYKRFSEFVEIKIKE